MYSSNPTLGYLSAIWVFLSAIPLPRIYPKEVTTDVHTVLTVAVFIHGKYWNPHKFPKTEEWSHKLWYIHTKELSNH